MSAAIVEFIPTAQQAREYEKETIRNLVKALTKRERMIQTQIQALNLRYDDILEAEEEERRR